MNAVLDLFWIPLVAMGLLSLILGPLGCFLVWRRMAFFSDGLSHACLLGIPIALMLHMHFLIGILLTAALGGGLFLILEKYPHLSSDTIFAALSYTLFALGIAALSLMESTHINTETLLFGDIFGLTRGDALTALCLVVCVGGYILRYRRVLILQSLSTDLASITFLNARHVYGGFMLLTSLVVALGMHMLGALLVPAMMVLPAAMARRVSVSPNRMLVWAMGVSLLGCVVGMYGSFALNTPLSPSIVLALALSGILLYTWHAIASFITAQHT